jgi:L-threonylcarbamoyladenylate synthase
VSRTLVLDAAEEPARQRAADLLAAGGLVAFPTETVYGLGALGLDPAAVGRIFVAKGRPRTDPLILHLAAADWLARVAREVPPLAGDLARAFWPGPLTLVIPRAGAVPDAVTAGRDTVAVRVPAHPVALDLITRVGTPIAAPSANRFSRPSPTTARHVLEDLDGRIDAVLDGGPTEWGLESTVLDVTGAVPRLLRPGAVTREALESALGGAVEVVEAHACESEAQEAPGMLTRHYSPRAELRVVAGDDAVALPALAAAGAAGVRVLAFTEDLAALESLPDVVELGPRADLVLVARRLYAAFREADEQGVGQLAVRPAPPAGLGQAINDRLRRAAAPRA